MTTEVIIAFPPTLGVMQWSQVEPVLVAMAIGVMIGAERERSHRDLPDHFGGVRTFTVLALSGALASLISPAVVAVGLGATGLLVAVSAWKSLQAHAGSTTVLVALSAYLLGVLTRTEPQLAVGVAVVLVVILMSKTRVHRVLQEQISEAEVEDAVKLGVVALVVLPLLPDRAMGPYGAINPFRIWLFVVAVIGIGWLGYIGVRILGARRGRLVSGAAAGFVSASATTSAMGRTARLQPAKARSALAGALAASVSTMVQLLLVVSVAPRPTAARLWLPAAAAALALAAAIALLLLSDSRERRAVDEKSSSAAQLPPPNEPTPKVRAFALRPALVLAVVITGTVLVSRWASERLGGGGAVGIAALAGLADGHAGAVSAASLAAHGDIATQTAVWAAGASIGTNTIVKMVLATMSGGVHFGRSFAVRVLPAAAIFALTLVFT